MESFKRDIKRVQEPEGDLENGGVVPVHLIDEFAKDIFNNVIAELGLIFDFVYTKSALVYTKTGCFLRLTSFACSFLVLLLFLINIMNKSKFLFSIVDIYVTGILLSGAIALELYAAWLMFSSDWAILVAALHHSVLVRKMFLVISMCFSCFLNQRKRWRNHMGQFDLLKYCWHYKEKKAKILSVCLQKITCCSDLIEMWRKYMRTDFVKDPTFIKKLMDEVYDLNSLDPFEVSRGKRALQAERQYDHLKWSIELDFDYSIIVWHLATSVCYYHNDSENPETVMSNSKCVSDYMMYLLVMRPGMLLPEDNKSFWLDHTYDKLKELFVLANDTKAASALLLKLDGENHESSNSTFENLLKDVRKLATSLNELQDKWKMIKEVWVEMLLYAAHSSSNISHVKQLGEGGEFLSLLWLLGGMLIMAKVNA